MKWLKRLFSPSAYDQGHKDGYQEGYREGQDWGHDHGACEHTHPFEETLAALRAGRTVPGAPNTIRAPGWGNFHGGERQ